MRLLWMFFFVILSWLSFMTSAEAAVISKVKGTAALIESEGDTLSVGEELFALDPQGKRKALIQITKIQGSKALGTVTKGTAAEGQKLQSRGAAASPSSGGSSSSSSGSGSSPNLYIGGVAALGMNSMQITVATGGSSNTFSTTGMDFGGKLLAEYRLSQSISVRGLSGYESLNSTGQASGLFCDNRTSQDCTTTVSYWTFELLGKFNFGNPRTTNYWGGGGLGFFMPLSKSSTAIKQDSITTSTVLELGGGVDLAMGSKGWKIPIQVMYEIFIPPGDVNVSIIKAHTGLMLPF